MVDLWDLLPSRKNSLLMSVVPTVEFSIEILQLLLRQCEKPSPTQLLVWILQQLCLTLLLFATHTICLLSIMLSIIIKVRGEYGTHGRSRVAVHKKTDRNSRLKEWRMLQDISKDIASCRHKEISEGLLEILYY